MKYLAILTLLCALILAACQPAVTQPAQPAPITAASTAAERIANAVSAAPAAIGKDATILDWPTGDGGDMVVLREGTSDWTCVTDWPASPGNDPMCFDSMFAEWNDALGAGAPLAVDRPGIAYMLAGGSDPSNTDPFAMEPAAGEDWISTPAHVMLLAPGGFDAADFSATPKHDEPYIMWDGTPYEHLMVPVVASPND